MFAGILSKFHFISSTINAELGFDIHLSSIIYVTRAHFARCLKRLLKCKTHIAFLIKLKFVSVKLSLQIITIDLVISVHHKYEEKSFYWSKLIFVTTCICRRKNGSICSDTNTAIKKWDFSRLQYLKNYSKKTIVFFIPQTSLSERHQSKAMTGKNELVQDKYIYFTINK